MPLLVTGASGRVGRALHLAWHSSAAPPASTLWVGRSKRQNIDIAWNIGQEPAPDLPQGAIILHLAAVISAHESAVAENRRLAEEVCMAARKAGAAHMFVMSSAAVYRPGATLCRESDRPQPMAAYGRAKLAAEVAAEALLPAGAGPGLTVLRLGNLAGADGLLGACQPGQEVTLDPVEGQARGPERSYIGPAALARVLAALVELAQSGGLPRILNIAQPPPMAMADLLDAKGQPWHFGKPNPAVTARVGLATERLARLVPLANATPAAIIADLAQFHGRWP